MRKIKVNYRVKGHEAQTQIQDNSMIWHGHDMTQVPHMGATIHTCF